MLLCCSRYRLLQTVLILTIPDLTLTNLKLLDLLTNLRRKARCRAEKDTKVIKEIQTCLPPETALIKKKYC